MSHRPAHDPLRSLGIEELKERLEIAPLLVGGDPQEAQIDNCCSCKLPPRPDDPDNPDPDG